MKSNRYTFDMPVVFLSDADRHWYRDVLISGDELYCSPRAPNDPPRSMSRPTGVYDAAAYIKSLPATWSDPSLVVVLDDAANNSIPRNIDGIKCPKVLIVCDTHHTCAPGHGPIWHALQHCLNERYDLVIGQFDRQHLHFFHEAGVNVAWLPCTTLTPFDHPVDTAKTQDVTFVGNTSLHPFRRHILEQLASLGIEVARGSAPQRETAALHSQSRINLNISLNGDLNLRHFEVLAAGGFLLTERLSPESGLSLLLKEHEHVVIFDNAVQLAELIRYYLANPAAAREIAVRGQAEYLRFHRPAEKIRQLYEMLEGKTPDAFDLKLDLRTSLPAQDREAIHKRVSLYELLQELHRNNLQLEVLFWPGAERHATDAIDLPRLKVSVLHGNSEGSSLLIASRLDARVHWIVPPELQRRNWALVVAPGSALGDAPFQQLLQNRRCGGFILSDFVPQRDAAPLQLLEQRLRFKRISAEPHAFALPAPGG